MDRAETGYETLRQLCVLALCGKRPEEPVMPDAAFTAHALALAERHRVVPLVAAGLSVAGDAFSMDAQTRESFRRRVLALAQQMVHVEQELGVLSTCLASAGVEFLLLKGPALARQAYALPDWRVYDDLDCWVASSDVDAAVCALGEVGYRPAHPLNPRAAACAHRAGIEVALRRPGGHFIEVSHGPRALAPSPRTAREVLDAAVEMRVGDVQVRTPAPVHALLLACAHGTHHRWDRFSWTTDVAGLWSRLLPEERVRACALARRWRLKTALGLGLRLAADQLELPLEESASSLANSLTVRRLVADVKLEQITHDGSLRVPMMERLRFESAAQDIVRQRLRMMARWIFAPTLGDIERVPLPPSLYFLYAGIRPLRLLRHPWLREWRRLFSQK